MANLMNIPQPKENPKKPDIRGAEGLMNDIANQYIDEQKELFDFQLSLAEQFKLPVSVHTRESWIDTMDLIEVHRDTRGIIHCFSGEENGKANLQQMRWCL